jgi:lanthanide-dependent methanol dehydrogenase
MRRVSVTLFAPELLAVTICTMSALCFVGAAEAGAGRTALAVSKETLRSQAGSPLIVGNMMYFEDSLQSSIYGVDLRDIGHTVWSVSPNGGEASTDCCDTLDFGLAYGDGRILANVADNKLVAIDARTGKVLWKVKTADDSQSGPVIVLSPLVARDKVIVGVSGNGNGVRGYLTAYDINSGRLTWRAYTTGADDETLINAAKTLNGATQRPVGKDHNRTICSTDGPSLDLDPESTWSSYDPQLNLIYYSTATPIACIHAQPTQEKQWAMTIFARDPGSGEAIWEHQMIPPGGEDYGGGGRNILVTTAVHGHRTPVLVHFDPDGFTFVLDRRTGKLVGARSYDSVIDWNDLRS